LDADENDTEENEKLILQGKKRRVLPGHYTLGRGEI
jgi:hypothetical protein